MLTKFRVDTKLATLAILTLLSIIATTILLPNLSFAQISFTADDFFVKLIENKADLTWGYAIYEIKNPTSSDMVLNDNTLITRIVDQPGATPVNSLKTFVLKTVGYSEIVTDYSDVCNPYNVTFENGTSSTVNNCSKVVSSLHWNNYTKEEWQELNSERLKPGKTYKIKIEATWPAKLGLNSREWFPQIVVNDINYEQSKWGWWNPYWKYRRQIKITAPPGKSLTKGWQINISLDTTNSSKFLASGNDTRIVVGIVDNDYEINRWNATAFGTNGTEIWFALDSAISTGSYNDSYYVYYGNDTPAGSPKDNAKDIFRLFIDYTDAGNWQEDGTSGTCWFTPVGKSFLNITCDGDELGVRTGFSFDKDFVREMRFVQLPGRSGVTDRNCFTLQGSTESVITYGNPVPGNMYHYQSGKWPILDNNFRLNTAYRVETFVDLPTDIDAWTDTFALNRSYVNSTGNVSMGALDSVLNRLEIGCGQNALEAQILISYIFFRNYSDPAPTVDVYGELENTCNGTLLVDLIEPSGNIEVKRGDTFLLMANVTCVGGCCGYVQGIADPVELDKNMENKATERTNTASTIFETLLELIKQFFERQ